MLALSLSDKFCCSGIFVFNFFVFVFNRFLFFFRFSFHHFFVLALVFVNEFVIFLFFTIFVFVNENHTAIKWCFSNGHDSPNSITSRLRSYEKYPRLCTRTKRYCSHINYSLSQYQTKITN